MHKVLILLIKFMPVIQMAGILLNNILYYFDICNKLSYISDFIIGNVWNYFKNINWDVYIDEVAAIRYKIRVAAYFVYIDI